MKKTATFFVFVCALVTCTECFERKTKCLAGDKHKDSLAPEESLFACQAYTQNSCCTRNFTKQLANSPIRKIDGFSWTPCNNTLSPKCEAFMVSIECFYRCSHNTIYWENPDFPSAMLNAPICAGFCDDWFDACKDDLTCAKNWLTDFNTTGPGNANTCKNPCRNFSDYYSGGKDLCESMWGSSFVYKETDCLQLNFTGPNPNDKLVEKLFGGNGNTTNTSDTTTTIAATATTATITGKSGAFVTTASLVFAITPSLVFTLFIKHIA